MPSIPLRGATAILARQFHENRNLRAENCLREDKITQGKAKNMFHPFVGTLRLVFYLRNTTPEELAQRSGRITPELMQSTWFGSQLMSYGALP